MAKRKAATGSKTKTKPPKQEPYALVYYTLDNTVGTVLRSKLVGDSIEVGTIVQAPLPIDYPEPSGDEMLEAVVITFGYSIHYLESTPVDESGQLIKDAIYAENSLALKKTSKAKERRFHSQAINNIDKEIDKLEDLSLKFKTPNDSSTTNGDEGRKTQDEQEGNDNNSEVITTDGADHLDATAGNIIQTQSVNCIPASCPLANIMKIASHENLNFLQEILIAIRQHRQNSQDQEQENKLPPTQENSPPTQENNEIELPPISLGDQFKALPCYQLTSDKMPLVENNGIYIERMIYASIPHVTPQLIQDKGKKMADDGSLFPRGMIKYLYELLVPEVIRKVAEPSDIPQDIKFVIKTYINLRLPPTVKLIDTKLNETLYDICRKEKKKQIKS